MRLWLALLLAALLGLTAGCRDQRRRSARAAAALARPGTREALIARALRAMRQNDPGAFVELLATVSEVSRACPKRFDNRPPGKLRAKWQRMLERTRKELARCADLIDWKKARQVDVKGGNERDVLPQCEEKVVRLHDIIVTMQVGSQRYLVRLAKPYQRGGTIYGFAKGPSCQAEL